jgi:hypothetical protein
VANRPRQPPGEWRTGRVSRRVGSAAGERTKPREGIRMSSEGNMVCGAHQVHALGDIDLQSLGSGVSIRAAGEEADLILDGSGTASLTCHPATLTMTHSGKTEGKIDLLAGLQGSITQHVGPPIIGAEIKMEPEKITLSMGPPGVGSMIEMTPTSITFKVGLTTVKITPTGITEEFTTVKRELNPLGHKMTAAETEYAVQVMGVTGKAPLQNIKVEAVNMHQETIGKHTSDAMRTQSAGIEMVS